MRGVPRSAGRRLQKERARKLELYNTPFIKLENVSYSYGGEDEDEPLVPVLKNVDLEIEKGSFVAVLGHNGSGKSTLAKLINLIIIPTEGKIFIDGKQKVRS